VFEYSYPLSGSKRAGKSKAKSNAFLPFSSSFSQNAGLSVKFGIPEPVLNHHFQCDFIGIFYSFF
jgi:hypothetical protein